MRESTIAASLVIDVLGYLERGGAGRGELLRAMGIAPARLEEAHARLPGSVMEKLWLAGERLTGDPDLGIHTAEAYNPGALSVFGYMLWSCRTCREALSRLARYASFLNEGLRVDVTEGGGRTVCRLGAASEGHDNYLDRSPRQVMEAMAAGVVGALRRLAASPVEPIAIGFRHAAPASIAEHRRVFGPTVLFGQQETRIVYATAGLEAGLLSANSQLLALFEGQVLKILAGLDSSGQTSRRVAAALARKLGESPPPIEDIAAELAMSSRTLQRELRAEGVSYRKLAEGVRREAAAEHLALPGVSVSEVAFLLGFSEPGAFTRAFRRWTGSAPTAFRG